MPTNLYFNNYGSRSEQGLMEDLFVEAIKIYGVDCYYLPIDNPEQRDLIYGEDPLKKFESAYPLEMYVVNVDGYGGEREFFSKFGLEIKNTMTVIVSKRSYNRWVPDNRPKEGDLIYVPFLSQRGEMYEIRYVDYSDNFYVLGNRYPYFYKLELEKFKYSQEKIETGVEIIDVLSSEDAYAQEFTLSSGTGNYIRKEIVLQGPDTTVANANTIAIVANWDSPNNVLKVTNIQGTFLPNVSIIGVDSGTSRTLLTYDPQENYQIREMYDNKQIQNEANSIVDLSETNPFGNIT